MSEKIERDLTMLAATYEPKPISTDGITLSAEVLELCEMLAENAHNVWAHARTACGWKYGSNRDEQLLTHPCLIPYQHLTESEKEVDRVMTREVLLVISKLGFSIVRTTSDSSVGE